MLMGSTLFSMAMRRTAGVASTLCPLTCCMEEASWSLSDELVSLSETASEQDSWGYMYRQILPLIFVQHF